MKLTFAPNNILQIDDARITYRNFAGAASKFNREGDRNFALVIPDMDIKDEMKDRGWNVKVKPPRSEDDDPFMYLNVKVKVNERGPSVYLETRGKKVKLDEDTFDMIDDIDIASVDLDIRGYNWDVNGKTGMSAYLQSMLIHQRITDRFAEEEYPEE